jgi:signal transduction histidine kinase
VRHLDRHSGSYRWFLARAAALRDDEGRVTRWFGTLTDIQAQREAAEKLGEALKLREDFLAIAGHELKTPLAALLMHVQSLQRAAEKGDGAVQVKERLAKASRASWRLDKLINELLDVSRITAGHLHLEVEPLDLVTLVRDVVATFKERASSPVIVRSSEAEISGAYDRVRVEQVVGNLLENALKYGEGRPVEVEVARDGAEAVVRVIDHGIGIDGEQQKRIFQRFERAVSTRDYGGLGLGLWISRQIVEASGGRVDVDSEPGEGSTFTVRLPLLH